MLKLVFVGVLLLTRLGQPQENYGLTYIAEQMNQYCRIHNSGTDGQGPTVVEGRVNYTAVEAMIATRLMETARKDSCTKVTRADAKSWNKTGGIFEIHHSTGKMDVYCDIVTDGGGWTVFQRRMDGSENFNREWAQYANGFGDAAHEFWIGLDTLHQLTSVGEFELRVDLGDWTGNSAYAVYSKFSVGDAASKYRLNIGEYTGTAGDALDFHRGMKFSTTDADNDVYSGNCAREHGGGWWFKECDHANLNGNYRSEGTHGTDIGVEWHQWKSSYSLKFAEMKFRPQT